ncbi:MAG: hypothetical protein Q8Q29_10310 [Actinomycetota bacterium]|nr:hypothetical protein [Actinomycetota bacterium]
MNPRKKTIVIATAAALLAVPLVASAQSDSPAAPNQVFHGHWADRMQVHDGMMSDGAMDHDSMMSDGHMATMMSDGGMGSMDPGGMSPGMTPADPAGHDGHHGSDSTQTDTP